jgi:hypothetical protein
MACSVLTTVLLEGHVDRVARGAGLVEGHQALFAEPGVDQRALADVGAAGHGQPDGAVGVFGLGGVVFLVAEVEGLQRRLEQAADALPVG